MNGSAKRRKWGGLILIPQPPKGTSLRGTAPFDVFCVKISARVSAVAFFKNPPPQKKIAESLCAEGFGVV